MEYLEESYPLKPLLPKDGVIRFKVREICEIIGSGIQPLQNVAVLKQFEESKQKDWAAKISGISKDSLVGEETLRNMFAKFI